ncbi:TrbC family F-type conjugative pilus assembly protein [Thermodesulfatator indicus]|nr:TrbC family F-type conjugative pilus assembly protein [Thermodesulfatator indicus]
MKKGPHYREAISRARTSAGIAIEKNRDLLKEKKPPGKRSPGSKNFIKKRYYLIISSSVPTETLRTYMAQIERLRKKGVEIVPVVRGFVGGMKKIRPTIEFYLKIALKDPSVGLSGDNLRPVAISVDPNAARGVFAVPALKTKDGSCTVYGDAPLPFLLGKIREHECGKRFGAVFEFAERDALAEIKEAAERAFPNPEKMRAFFARRVREFTYLPGAKLLPPAKETRFKVVKPEYELPFDVRDPKTGEILYPRGYRFNPLEYAPSVPFEVLLINGTRQKEVAFARRMVSEDPHLSVWALGGDARKLSGVVGRPVFSGETLARKGWCAATPCLVRRKGEVLEVKEFGPKEIKGGNGAANTAGS